MSNDNTQLATLAGGCFWCLEAVFQQVKGVAQVISGYSGGHVANPSYQQVCSETTGHAEVVQITFDPSIILFKDIMFINTWKISLAKCNSYKFQKSNRE